MVKGLYIINAIIGFLFVPQFSLAEKVATPSFATQKLERLCGQTDNVIEYIVETMGEKQSIFKVDVTARRGESGGILTFYADGSWFVSLEFLSSSGPNFDVSCIVLTGFREESEKALEYDKYQLPEKWLGEQAPKPVLFEASFETQKLELQCGHHDNIIGYLADTMGKKPEVTLDISEKMGLPNTNLSYFSDKSWALFLSFPNPAGRAYTITCLTKVGRVHQVKDLLTTDIHLPKKWLGDFRTPSPQEEERAKEKAKKPKGPEYDI